MLDGPAPEKSTASNEAQTAPKASLAVSPAAAAEKRHNFLYNLIHRGKKVSAKPVVVEPVPTPVAAVKRAEPAPAKPLTPAQIKRAELEESIAEADEGAGLKVALEGRLESWHTKINGWLIGTEKVPEPMSLRERLTEIARTAFDPSAPDKMPEDFKRQGVQAVREQLRVAEKLVTSLRLRLGGPYSKGGQNGSDN